MADSQDNSKRKRRRVSPIDKLMARERGQMETQMRRNAVLQYVGEQLVELNELLRGAGFGAAPSGSPPQPMPSPYYQVPYIQQPQAAAVARPCVWCGQPGTPVNVGNGVIQDLCAGHMRLAVSRPQVDGSGKPVLTNFTDAPRAPQQAAPSGKRIMQPTAADVRASQQHAQDAVANGDGTPQGFVEMEEPNE